jgi:hypothetical protein
MGPNSDEERDTSTLGISVEDPGCLSRILIFTHPGSRIQKQQQKRGVQKISCHTIFVAINFTKYNLLFPLFSIRSDNFAFHLGDVILTYSDSSLIEKLLLDARADKKNFKVIVSDGRVQLSGETRFSSQKTSFSRPHFLYLSNCVIFWYREATGC